MTDHAEALAKALEDLEAKAQAQKDYFEKKQQTLPSLERLLDDEGMLVLPDDISPLLDHSHANGRYSEADWWLSTIRSALAAYRSRPAAEVVVKPLEWDGTEGGPGCDVQAEPTPFMKYSVRHLSSGRFDVILNTDTGSLWFNSARGELHGTYCEARSAAQADYEQRILPTLATPALAGTEPAGEVVEAARAVIEQKFSTYKARNGREVGIQDENGEKCWIVPFDEMFALESALRDQSEA